MSIKLYSISEVASILGCNRTRVYEMIKNGELPYIQLGTMKIEHATLYEYIKSKEKVHATITTSSRGIGTYH